MPKTLNTPVTQLRMKSPRGSLRQEDVRAALLEDGLELARITISDFERGKYLPADLRFIPLYAKAIGKSQKAVREAYELAHAEWSPPEKSPKRRRASG